VRTAASGATCLPSSQEKNARTATAYAARVFGLRMLAVKKSRKRSDALSPASAISLGT
jgi:hypothetical protein